MSADLALLGGGGACLAVLHHVAVTARVAAHGSAASRPPGGSWPLRVAVVDPLDRLATRPADRTWCSWDQDGSRTTRVVGPAVHRSWREVVLVTADGRPRVLDLAPLRYRMVRSQDWYALVAADVARAEELGLLDVVHLAATAGGVEDAAGVDDGDGDGIGTVGAAGGGARVQLLDGPGGAVTGELVADAVLDSRPAPPRHAGATTLLQHFRGRRVQAATGWVDPARAVLMDFSVPQPPVGLAFGYLLPDDERTALAEYTEFSPAVLTEEQYDDALHDYLGRVAPGAGLALGEQEAGVIPMTDATFTRRAGPRTWRIGTAGGAVRPSTGYAFSAMQRQAAAVADQLVGGLVGGAGLVGRAGLVGVRDPRALVVPRPYPRRHAWCDALVLRGLRDGSIDGPAFFARLFARNPPARVLRFLDGLTGPGAELAVMATAPGPTMVRLATADALGRAGRLTAAARGSSRRAWAGRGSRSGDEAGAPGVGR